jgi:hypothetical protein
MYSEFVVVETTSPIKEKHGISNLRTWELVCNDHTLKAKIGYNPWPYKAPFSWFLTLTCKTPLRRMVVQEPLTCETPLCRMVVQEPALVTHAEWIKFLDTPEGSLNIYQDDGNEVLNLMFRENKFVFSFAEPHKYTDKEVRMPAETVRRILKTVVEAQFEAGRLHASELPEITFL